MVRESCLYCMCVSIITVGPYTDNGRLFSVTGFIDRSVIKKNTSKPSFSVLMKEEKIELP